MKKFLFLAIAITFVVGGINAQTVVINPEAGKLKKQIKKKEYADITNLKVSGILNDQDMMFLGNLTNLEKLDLSETVGETWQFPSLPKLHTLAIGKDQNFSEEADSNLVKCSQLQSVSVYHSLPAFCKTHVRSLKNLVLFYDYSDHSPDSWQNDLVVIDTLKLKNVKESNTLKVELTEIIKNKVRLFGSYLPRFIMTSDGQVVYNGITKTTTDFSNDHYLLDIEQSYDIYYPSIPDTLNLSGVKWVSRNHFRSTDNVQKIIFSGDIEYIESQAFNYFKNLEEVVIEKGKGSLTIEAGAFSDCPKLKSIIIGKPAIIEEDFETIQMAKFDAVPISLCKNFTQNADMMIYVPEGTKNKFVALGLNASNITDGETRLEYDIKLEKGGSILSYLPLKDLTKIKSLTVTGILYETDLEIIGKCKNLEYLDLGKTWTTYSPQKMKELELRSEFFAGMFNHMREEADAEYDNYEMTAKDYVQAKIYLEMLKPISEVKTGDPGCLIPSNCINDLPNLTTLVLPYRAENILSNNFNNCPKLKTIQWPLYLKTIRSNTFVKCTSLTELVFPSSLSFVGGGSSIIGSAFSDCTNMRLIDLSNCTFTDPEWYQLFDCHARNLTIKFPKGITKLSCFEMGYQLPDKNWIVDNCTLYLPESVANCKFSHPHCCGYTLHFAGTIPPTGCKNGVVRQCKIYCPKGSLTSYYTAFGGDEYENEFFEE